MSSWRQIDQMRNDRRPDARWGYNRLLTDPGSPNQSMIQSNQQSNQLDNVDSLAVELFGFHIHALTEAQTLDCVERAIDAGALLRIGVVNAAKVVAMRKDRLLWQDVTTSDLILADGMSIVWASRFLGRPLPERVAGIDLMFRLFELADGNGLRVYCLGASEDVSAQVASNLAQDYPGLVLAGRRNGYFGDDEADQVAREIADSGAQILLVAMTTPKKENFMGAYGDSLGVNVVHGVGGSFDVYAGKVERAPASWQRLGLEWLYRVKQEPRRLWKRYAKTNFAFLWLVMRERLHL